MAFLTTDIEVKEIKPTGYHVLVELLNLYDEDDQGNKKLDSGILIAAEVARKEESVVSIAKILEFGPGAFKKLANGCNSPKDWGVEVGDVVSIPSSVGESASTNPRDKRRIILDQDIKAVVTIEEK